MPRSVHDGMAEFLGRKFRSWLDGLPEAEGFVIPNHGHASAVAEDVMDYEIANISIFSDINSHSEREDVRQADKSYEYQVSGSEQTLPDLVMQVISTVPPLNTRTAGTKSRGIHRQLRKKRPGSPYYRLPDFYPDPYKTSIQTKCGKISILRAKVDTRRGGGRASVDEAMSVRGKVRRCLLPNNIAFPHFDIPISKEFHRSIW